VGESESREGRREERILADIRKYHAFKLEIFPNTFFLGKIFGVCALYPLQL